MRTVSDIGEAGIVARMRQRLGPVADGEIWSGDDAAVIRGSDQQIFTTDTMVEGVDFELAWAGGADIGWKAMAVNVSDAAAMGARPTHAVATLALPDTTPVAFVDDVTEGLAAAAARWDVALVGGDISRAPQISLGIALVGRPFAGGPVLRSGARAGDALCITGTPGLAAHGLHLLLGGGTPQSELDEAAIARQLRPTARVEESALICGHAPTAMIDVSDGVAIDLDRLLSASEVGCTATLPETAGIDPDDVALGGEDFELLFTISEGGVAAVVEALTERGTLCHHIGTVTPDGRTLGGRSLEAWKESAWDHLQNR